MHPKFTTLQRSAYPFLSPLWIFTLNLSASLEFSRNKHISSHAGQELKTLTNTPSPEKSYTKQGGIPKKKILSGLPSQKLKPDLRNGSSGLYRYTILFLSQAEQRLLFKHLQVLFKFLFTTFLMKPSVQLHKSSPKN